MQSNTNNDVINSLQDSIDLLSKNLYLESPDLYIDFSDKISYNKFDEMVLFFSAKYNCLPIIAYAVENDLIDLNAPSKNKSYPNIFSHLFNIAKKSNFEDICNYLESLNENYEEDANNTTESTNDNNVVSSSADKPNQNEYLPYFNCPNCKVNILENGYRALSNNVYKFNQESKKIIKISENELNYVLCLKCNHKIADVNTTRLQAICSVSNCSSCGNDLSTAGITSKSNMMFDSNSNKFVSNTLSYHCAKCDNKITNHQVKHFNL